MKGKGFLFLLVFIVVSNSAWAEGGLMVTPKRLIFEGRDRSGFVTLVNSGESEKTYRVGFKEMIMGVTGSLEDIKSEDAKRSSSGMIRFSPRQVTIAPGEQQVVRMLLRKPKDIEESEYRSHLLVEEVPASGGFDASATQAAGKSRVGVVINAMYGVSAPIIVRHGRLMVEAGVEVKSLRLTEGGDPRLSLLITRDGERSVYGDIEVYYLADIESEPKQVSVVRGISVYTTINSRELVFDLPKESLPRLSSGLIRVNYVSRERSSDGELMAKTEYALAAE